MPDPEDAVPEQTVQTPRATEHPPLSPEGDDAAWKENRDAGREEGPTTAHEAEGWRAAEPGKP